MHFDIESLFTNVPLDTAVQAALQKLKNDLNLTNRTAITKQIRNFKLHTSSITDQFINTQKA